MDSQAKKQPDSEISLGDVRQIKNLLSPRVTRRQLLKASLVGVGGLAAAAGGLKRLETLAAAPPGPRGWRQLAPKAAPRPRAGAAMAYDAARGMPVLFGGGADADTWIWRGATWNRLSPSLNPPARFGASFAYYPPTKTLVLFGGGNARGWFKDTWLWNGKTWSLAPGSGPRPRAHASMAFDPATANLILFGGAGDGLLGDTWRWDGRAWRPLSPSSSPPPLVGAGFAYSAAAGKLILFGGTRFQGAMGGSQETWAWDGTNWSEVSFGSSPPARKFAAMASDPAGKLLLLFGGTGDSLLGDTWTFTGTWLRDTRSPAPPPRARAFLVPDPSSNSLLLFGGERRGGPLGDTWAWGPY